MTLSASKPLAVRPLLSVVGMIGAVVIGAVVAHLAPSSLEPGVIGLIAFLLAAPIAYRIIQRRFDLFEPVVIVNLALSYLFVLRPAADLVVSSPYNVEATFTTSLMLVLAGIGAFEFGYLLPLGTRLSSALPVPSASTSVGRLIGFAAFLTMCAIGLFAAFVVASGGTSVLTVLGAGRSTVASSVYLSSTGYLYNGPQLAIPACLVLLALALSSKGHRLQFLVLSAIPAAFAVAAALPQGNRTSLVALALPCLALPYVIRHRRPHWIAILLFAYVFLTVGGYIAQNRNAVTDRPIDTSLSSVIAPAGAAQHWITGGEGSEFDILAVELQAVPSLISFSPGATLVDLGTRAVPRVVWPDKPLERSDALTASLFPQVYFDYRSNLLPSMVGILYMDSGPLTVLAGMAILGVILRILWEYFQKHRQLLFTQLLYVTCIPLMFLTMRDSPGQVLGELLFTAGPLVAMFWFAGTRDDRSAQVAAPQARRERSWI